MSLIWHLIKSNIIFNKFRLTLFSLFCLAIAYISNHFTSAEEPNPGSVLIQNGIYMVFIIFTGKLSAGNKLMFGLKNLHGLPISKRHLIFSKSIADIIFFLPAAFLICLGLIKNNHNYHSFFFVVALIMALFVMNLVSLKKRIDFSRTQHSNASFKNSILWFHRILEMGLGGLILSFVYLNLKVVAGSSIFTQEYLVVLSLAFIGFVMYKHTLKLFQDERLSYFFLKRDSIRIGWKLCVFILPLVALKLIDVKSTSAIAEAKREVASIFKGGASYVLSEKLLSSIKRGDLKALKKYEKLGVAIKWKNKNAYSLPIHLAVRSNNPEMIDYIMSKKKNSLELKTNFSKRTPLHVSMQYCNLNSFEHLKKLGASLESIDAKGNTLGMITAQANCYGGLLLLKKYGYDLEKSYLRQGRESTALDFVSKKSGMLHILESAEHRKSKRARKISSIKKKTD